MIDDSLDVSFIIPTHNRPQFLAETISSVLSQTRQAREIIVVDNGIRGAAAKVIGEFDDRVRLITSTPNCVQEARNMGFRSATST